MKGLEALKKAWYLYEYSQIEDLTKLRELFIVIEKELKALEILKRNVKPKKLIDNTEKYGDWYGISLVKLFGEITKEEYDLLDEIFSMGTIEFVDSKEN